MTQLTYTIAHIKVGAENYWEEVEGFVSGDKESLLFDKKKIDDIIIRYAKNNNHPLFDLANELGANIYGGFLDEKDFYLVIPTVEGLKVGDFTNDYILSFNEYDYSVEDYDIDTNIGVYGVYGFYWHNGKNWMNNKNIFDNYHRQIKDNLFKEYAKTGILNNDIYKQFFE